MSSQEILRCISSTILISVIFMTPQINCYKNYSQEDIIFELRKFPDIDDRNSIVYKYHTTDWEDIGNLVKDIDGYQITVHLCARGTWLIYDAPRLTASSPGEFNGTWLYSTDKRTCITRSNLRPDYFSTTFTGSIQPVTSYRKKSGDHITFFPQENFAGRRMVVSSRTKPHDQPPTYSHYINSLITVGKKNWIVIMDNVRLCFVPDQSMNVPVCYITNLIDEINTFPGGPLAVHHSNGSCNPDDSTVVTLTACYENTHGLIPLNTTWPFGVPPNNTGGGECTDEEDILKDEHVELIASRLNGSLGTGEWFSAIKDPKDIWKAELFDKSFQVLLKICPEVVIEKEYLLLFASLYWLHLGKIWDEGRYKNVTISELEWMEMLYDMNTCVEALDSGDYNGIATDTANEMKSYKSLNDVTEKIDDMLGVKPDYDHVMEINWLMGNLVAAICSKARQFDVNFLQRFLNAYQMLYYSPVETIWEKPADYAEIYKYLFGGYGMEKSITKIGLCTLNAMKFSGLTEPYKRPMEQADRIFLPKSLGDECDDNATVSTTQPI